MGNSKFRVGDVVIPLVGKFKAQPGEIRAYDLARRSYFVRFRKNGEYVFRSFRTQKLR
jgi:hypothetical protein